MQKNNPIVRYKNEINRASHYLDVIEQRIILRSIAKIPKGSVTDQQIYYVSSEDLVELGTNKKLVYGQMKNAADTLFNRYITLPVDGAKGKGIRKFRWVQSVEYFEGEARIGLRFSTDLLPFITNLQEQFTHYGILDLTGLRSSYAIRLYSILMQFQSTKKLIIKVEDLRERLDLGNKFKMYADFKKKVIERAVEQINEGKRTQIKVKFKEKKLGRKVETLIFTMEMKNQIIDVDGTIIDSNTGDLFAEGLSIEQAKLSEKQIAMYADFLSGKNQKYSNIASSFYSDCRKKGLLFWEGKSTEACASDLVEKLALPEFVIAIYPWLKKVGFNH